MMWSGRALIFLSVEIVLPPSESYVCWSFNSKAVDVNVCCGGMSFKQQILFCIGKDDHNGM